MALGKEIRETIEDVLGAFRNIIGLMTDTVDISRQVTSTFNDEKVGERLAKGSIKLTEDIIDSLRE